MIEPSEVKIGKVFVKLEQSTSDSSPSQKKCALLQSGAAVHAFTIGISTVVGKNEKTSKFYGFSMKYRLRHHRRHSQWTGILFWDNSHEKYFHQFSNSYVELCFSLDIIKNQ